MEANPCARGLKSRIHRKGKRGKPLTDQGKASNRTRSAVRARVAHVSGGQIDDMGGTLVRIFGLIQAAARIGMKNLAWNEERQHLIRRIDSPTTLVAGAAPPCQPVSGVTEGADVRLKGPKSAMIGGSGR